MTCSAQKFNRPAKPDKMHRSVSLGVLILYLISLPRVASARQCPLSKGKGNCSADAVCAVFVENSGMCVGWATYRCARGQYRDLNTCACINCPRRSGLLCTEDNECCSVEECTPDPAPASTPKPFALAWSSRLSPFEADCYALLLLFLLWMLP